MASADNWTVSNTKVPDDVYPSKLPKKAANTFFSPDTELAVGPSTLASAAVSTAFWQGLVQYLKDPTSLDQVLATIQKAQEASTT